MDILDYQSDQLFLKQLNKQKPTPIQKRGKAAIRRFKALKIAHDLKQHKGFLSPLEKARKLTAGHTVSIKSVEPKKYHLNGAVK
jgi:hypothetical protein